MYVCIRTLNVEILQLLSLAPIIFFVSSLIKNSNYSLNVIRISKIKNALKFKHKNNFKFKECFILTYQ